MEESLVVFPFLLGAFKMSTTAETLSVDETTADFRSQSVAPPKAEGPQGLVAYKGVIESLGKVAEDNNTGSSTYKHIRIKGESAQVFLTDVVMSRRCQSYMKAGAIVEIICDRLVHKGEEKYLTYAIAVDGAVVNDIEGVKLIIDGIKKSLSRFTFPLYMMSLFGFILGVLTVIFFIGWIILVVAAGAFFMARKGSKFTKKFMRHISEDDFRRFCGALTPEYALRQIGI